MAERGLDRLSIELSSACDLSAWISTKLYDVTINATTRNRVVAACFAVVLDHFDAILALLGRNPKIYSSAFALTRLVFESYIRGMWLMHCATDEQVENFSEGTFQLPRRIEVMIGAIEKTCDFDGQLSISHSSAWSHLCDYTHTGTLQVQRWNKSDAIEPNYPDDEIIEVIRFTKTYALLTAVSFAEAVISNSALTNEFLVKAKEIGVKH